MDLNNDGFKVEFTNAKEGLVGRFTFEGDICKFEGNADDSAKLFIEEVKKAWGSENTKVV